MSAGRGRRQREARGPSLGQATVELAIALPVLLALVLVVVNAGLVARDQILLTEAARSTARAAARADGAAAPTAAEVARLTGLDPARLSVSVHDDAAMVVATATYRSVVAIPFGPRRFVTLDARVTMQAER